MGVRGEGVRREFLVVSSTATTTGGFSLKDLPGSAGRMDIVCRCVNSAFFLSHDIRRDTRLWLLLLGEPNPPILIRFEGSELRYLSPDERSAASLISKALGRQNITEHEILSTPGVYIRKGDMKDVLEGCGDGTDIIYLVETGEWIREIEMGDKLIFVLGDHMGLGEEYERLLADACARNVSVGQKSLHVDHCMIVVHNELDIRRTLSKAKLSPVPRNSVSQDLKVEI